MLKRCRTKKYFKKICRSGQALSFAFSKNAAGQVMQEFSFCMILVLLLIYGTMMIFRWTGIDFAERRRAHEQLLYTSINQDYGSCNDANCTSRGERIDGPLRQIYPDFYTKPAKMNAVWTGQYNY